MNGTIARLNIERGFGFIKGDDEQEYFVHRTAVKGSAIFEELRDGQSVSCAIRAAIRSPKPTAYQ